MNPDTISTQGAGVGDVSTQNPAATSQATPPAGAGSTSPSTPAGGSNVSQGASTPATPPGDPTVRDVLAGYGLDVRNQFQNDHAALQHLAMVAQQAQQQQQLIPYAQEYLQNAAAFQQWQQEQQRARQAQQQQQESWWKAPEYDPSWKEKIYRDAQGNLQVLPGNDPFLLQKYNAWVNHQQKFLNDFSRDPIGAIKPGIEQMVAQQAQQIVQQQLAAMREQTAAQQFVQQNSDWLHEKQNGQLVIDPRTGQPALSSLGRQFAQYVFQAHDMGLRDTASQQRYAMALMERDYYAAKMGGQQGVTQQQTLNAGDAAKANFLQQAAAAGAATQQTTQANTQGTYNAPQGMTMRGLQEMMAKEFAAAGIQPGQQLIGNVG